MKGFSFCSLFSIQYFLDNTFSVFYRKLTASSLFQKTTPTTGLARKNKGLAQKGTSFNSYRRLRGLGPVG